jgi:parallel beta-helix repeat protein
MLSEKIFNKSHRLVVYFITILTLTFCGAAQSARAADIFVTSTNDSGAGSLRQAIVDANATTAPDIIKFSIGAGAKTITLQSALPIITERVTIDGTTQPGYAGVPLIELNGNNLMGNGIWITANSCFVKGLIINRFAGNGIVLSADHGTVLSNYIGTNANGSVALGNTTGIHISGLGNVIGGTSAAARNVISGNTSTGIFLNNGSNNFILNNYIGTNAAGDGAIGNGTGIVMRTSNNSVGIPHLGAVNLISGNLNYGIKIESPNTGNVVAGNIIGLNAAGTAKLGNGGDGIYVSVAPTDLTIGGTQAGDGNTISGNGGNGVTLTGGGNRVQGNRIGTNVAGDVALGNSSYGVAVLSTSSVDALIGGTQAGARNIISGNGNSGIKLNGATNSMVQGNYIGTNLAGTAALLNNGSGVEVITLNAVIGGNQAGAGNLISGNAMHGIDISNGTNHTIQGNLIGTNAAGTSAIGNALCGLRVARLNIQVGGATPLSRNIVSGNGEDGIRIESGSNVKVQGNFVGTNLNGSAAIPNQDNGIEILIHSNKVGGTQPGEGNLISGNAQHGLVIAGISAHHTTVQGNYIGTDINGTSPVGNGGSGVYIHDSQLNTIGGPLAAYRNVISANHHGITLKGGNAVSNFIVGNFIGTKADGTSPLGNNHIGVNIDQGLYNTIGGATVGNTIAHNADLNVYVHAGNGNSILGNSIFSSPRPGIELEPLGVGINDAGDIDSGPNQRQNYPVLSQASTNGNNAQAEGQINSTPNREYRIEFFSNPSCHPSGFGEGRTYLGSATVTTDASGYADIDSPSLPPVVVNSYITATATDNVNKDSSEFSPCVKVNGSPGPGQLQFMQGTFTAYEHQGEAVITVTRAGGVQGTVTVAYATSPGQNATSPEDYTHTSGTLTFAEGEVVKTFAVPIAFDNITEPGASTINLTLTNPTGGATLGGQSTAVINLIDYNFNNPAVSVADVTVYEGISGTTDAVFTVTLTPHNNTVTVHYETQNGDALAGSDYETRTGTLIFNPGETTQIVAVPVIGDNVEEGEQSFYLSISEAQNANVADELGEAFIKEGGPSILQFSAQAYQVNEDEGVATITITRTGNTNQAVSATYSSTAGTATALEDFKPVSGTLDFAAGQTSNTFEVEIKDDLLDEQDETLNLTLGNPSTNVALGNPNTALLTISDNDEAPTPTPQPTPTPEPTPTPTPEPTPTPTPLSTPTPQPTPPAQPSSSLEFSLVSYAASEDAQFVTINVNRTGDASQAATVFYSTSDGAGLTPCPVAEGKASERCDYATSVGTLRWSAGDSQPKSFVIPIVDDVHIEGTETFIITLSNPTGATLGPQTTATVILSDNGNDVTGATNPIDDIAFFVRQQYIDFLGRLPDQTGFQNWVGTITGCPDGGYGINNPTCDRVHVAKSTYQSVEFQTRGYWAYRFYEVAFGRRPGYSEFIPDMAQVGGPKNPQEEALSKAEYTQAFVQRSEFMSRYGAVINDPVAYVNLLLQTAGLTNHAGKAALINQLQSGQKTPAEVLREVVESQDAEDYFYVRGFVSMMYYGFLRRDPDPAGFQNYVNQLNQTWDPRKVTFDFIYSPEYMGRFGQP